MFFVTLNGKGLSKHKTFETAEKKRIANTISDRRTLNKYGRNFITPYKVVEAEKGSELFIKLMDDVAFAKECKEKYNMAYQRKDPEGYAEFLKKKEARK